MSDKAGKVGPSRPNASREGVPGGTPFFLGLEDRLKLARDRRGFLWLGTGGGLNRYDGYELKVYRHDPDDPESMSASEVMVLNEDRQGSLWLGTRSRGLNRFDLSEERFERYEHDPEDPESLLGNRVRSLFEDRSGTLWVGTRTGLSRFRRETGRFTRAETLKRSGGTCFGRRALHPAARIPLRASGS